MAQTVSDGIKGMKTMETDLQIEKDHDLSILNDVADTLLHFNDRVFFQL